MTDTPLRVLLLEDSADDAELLVHELRRAGFDTAWERVEDPAGLREALDRAPDILLTDYSLPQFNAIDALHLLRESGRDTPAIVVSGIMSEEACVEALRHGAVDYLLKDRLVRLGPAVRHALNQQRLVRDRRRAELAARRQEQRFHAAFDNAPIGMAVTTLDGHVTEVNPALSALIAQPTDELRGRPLAGILAAPNRYILDEHIRDLTDGRVEVASHEVRLRHADGHAVWAHYSASLIDDPEPQARRVVHQFLDITDRRRNEQALQRQAEQLAASNAELMELDRLKSQFVATVSHELRTPLSSICGYTELLVDGELGQLSAGEQRIVGIIDRNGRRLLSIIEDLLTFSRLEAGTLTLAPVPVDLADLARHASAQMQPMAGKAGVTLSVDAAADLPKVSADPAHLERVLLNLLSNAVKFSPDGGSTTVALRGDEESVTVSVSDTGMGIPAEEQRRLFQRFYRTSAAESRAIGGTGLGLAITKAIVEAHGGGIALESEVGRGTTVTFWLPLGTDPAHAG